MSDQSISPSSSVQDWLAVWVDTTRVMLPAQEVHAVFSAQHPPRDDAIAPLDVEIHGGVPVFMVDLKDGLSAPSVSDASLALPWVVAWRTGDDEQGTHALKGCRVAGIRGPVRASAHNGMVEFDGLAWPVHPLQ